MDNVQSFLIQEFQKRKQRNPNFSLRAFSKWLDISPAQLSQMMTGKRTITVRTLKKITDRIGSTPFEQNELINALLKDHSILENRQTKQVLHLQEDRFRFISDWYHMAILSLTKLPNKNADPRWVARQLGISIEEASHALLRLQRLGFIETEPEFKQICDPLEVVSDFPSVAIQKYHKQNLALAAEKIETVPLPLRQFQSLSLTMNPAQMTKFKKLIDRFLEQSSDLADQGPLRERTDVYHLNVQLFPVTQTKES